MTAETTRRGHGVDLVPSEPAAAYAAFRGAILRAAGEEASRLREPEGQRLLFADPPNELALQCRWFGGEFGRLFRTVDGDEVEVIDFGHWNRAAGPDFTDVVVRVGGERRRGALELDVEARSWEHHGHAVNPAFDEVVLHVFFDGGEAPRFFTRTASHREVPQVRIDPGADGDAVGDGAGRLVRKVPEARLGRCAAPLAGLSERDVESLLEAAARHRLERKARRVRRMTEAHGWAQALFEGIAESLGYRSNRLAMRLLAQRLPIAVLRREGEAAEALLFGVAGLLDGRAFDQSAAAARPYLRELWETWWRRRDEFAGAAVDPAAPAPRGIQWTFSGVRPVNRPERRLAALAVLVSRWREFARLVGAADGEARRFESAPLEAFLGSFDHPFWREHCTLATEAAARPMALVGAERARDIVANWLAPFRLGTDEGVWEAYRRLPGGSGNRNLRRAVLRLFGDAEAGRRWGHRYWQQQGLQEVFDDFCLADATGCSECPFPEQLRQWRAP